MSAKVSRYIREQSTMIWLTLSLAEGILLSGSPELVRRFPESAGGCSTAACSSSGPLCPSISPMADEMSR